MPVVLRIRGYRFEFYSSDCDEPPHIHVKKDKKHAKFCVKKDKKHAKFWLKHGVSLAFSREYRGYELNRVEKMTQDHREKLLEAWHGFFGQ